MAYNGSTRNGKKSSNLEKHLRLEDRLSSDKKPVKIGDEVSGLLLSGKDVHIEGDLLLSGNIRNEDNDNLNLDNDFLGKSNMFFQELF